MKNSLSRKISKILFLADPLGISFENNSDEYDGEAERIKDVLAHCQTVAELQKRIHEIFVSMFDEQLAGNVERYASIAATIWELK